jgi:hypothetical protein
MRWCRARYRLVMSCWVRGSIEGKFMVSRATSSSTPWLANLMMVADLAAASLAVVVSEQADLQAAQPDPDPEAGTRRRSPASAALSLWPLSQLHSVDVWLMVSSSRRSSSVSISDSLESVPAGSGSRGRKTPPLIGGVMLAQGPCFRPIRKAFMVLHVFAEW